LLRLKVEAFDRAQTLDVPDIVPPAEFCAGLTVTEFEIAIGQTPFRTFALIVVGVEKGRRVAIRVLVVVIVLVVIHEFVY
jgi:hypothetical protein